MRSPDHSFESGDVYLRYRDEGDGEVLVFVHGWTLDLEMWDAQAAEFSRTMRVIRYDRRGHGLSGGAPGPAHDLCDLVALLDRLRIPRATVVGMSQGARTALAFAIEHPERVAGLVLDGPPDFRAGTDQHERMPVARFRELARTVGLEAFRAAWRDDPLMRLHSGDRAATELVARALSRYRGVELLDPAPPTATAVDTRAIAGLEMPVLIVVGERDCEARQAAAAWLRSLLPQAEWAPIAQAGHLPNLDQPRAYGDALRQFLRRGARAAA
jgi:3-oxoadipate enol-lactonase